MRLNPPKIPPTPIDAKTFRRNLVQAALIQLAALVPGLLIHLLGLHYLRADFQILGLFLMVFSTIVCAMLVSEKIGVSCRLLDIYPDLPLRNSHLFGVFWICPFLAPLVALFLALKKTSSLPTPWLFRHPIKFRVFCMTFPALLVLAIGLSPLYGESTIRLGGIAYSIANPTIYYISALADDIQRIGKIRKGSPTDKGGREVMAKFEQMAHEFDVTTTGEILAMAAAIQKDTPKDKGRGLASDERLERALLVIEDVVRAVEISDHAPPTVLGYNPISYLNFTGPIELSLITSIVALLEVKFRNQFFPKTISLMNLVEKNLKALPESKSAHPLSRLSDLRGRFIATRSFALYSSANSTWLGRHVLSKL